MLSIAWARNRSTLQATMTTETSGSAVRCALVLSVCIDCFRQMRRHCPVFELRGRRCSSIPSSVLAQPAAERLHCAHSRSAWIRYHSQQSSANLNRQIVAVQVLAQSSQALFLIRPKLGTPETQSFLC